MADPARHQGRARQAAEGAGELLQEVRGDRGLQERVRGGRGEEKRAAAGLAVREEEGAVPQVQLLDAGAAGGLHQADRRHEQVLEEVQRLLPDLPRGAAVQRAAQAQHAGRHHQQPHRLPLRVQRGRPLARRNAAQEQARVPQEELRPRQDLRGRLHRRGRLRVPPVQVLGALRRLRGVHHRQRVLE